MPDYSKLFREILNNVEQCSTCARLSVGALIIREGRIISTGWNGTAKGQIHCKQQFHDEQIDKQKHKEFSDRYEIHAEQNAIGFSARNGLSTYGADLYLSISPCIYCAKLVVAAGIKNVYYFREYDRDDNGIKFLKENNVNCEELKYD